MDSLYNEWLTNPDDTSRAYALIFYIDYLNEDQQIDSAYKLSLLAKEFAKNKNLKYIEAYAYENLGVYTLMKSQYDSALFYDLLSYKVYSELKDTLGIANSLNSIGEDYFEREFYSMAYDYYHRAYLLARDHRDTLLLAITTYNLGRVLKEQGYYERALDNIDRALSFSQKIGDEVGVGYAYFDVGDIYLKQNKIKDAKSKLKEALEISMNLSEFILIPQIYNKLGEVYEAEKDYDKAIESYEEALNQYVKQNNKLGIGETFKGLGSVYAELGDNAKAEEYFKECLSLASDVKSMELKSKCYFELADLFESKGQLPLAFEYYKQYKVASDSVFNSKKSEQLSQMQIEHVTQQHDLEIELLNQREAQQQEQIKQDELIRNVLVVIMAFFVILLITLYRSSTRRKRMNNLLMAQQHELEQQRSELVELNKVKDKFFSIISHDLRSPINNLAGMSSLLNDGNLTQQETKNLAGSIQKQLKHASKLLDNLLDWVLLQSNEIKIKKEPINLHQVVEQNIALFNELNDKELDLVNAVDDVDVLADKNMLDLVIRNLISNSMKFTEKGGRIVVTNNYDDEKVVVCVTDNGIGVPEAVKQDLFEFKAHYSRKGTANEKGTGLGLKLCKEFIERIGGRIWVESEEGHGSTFKFTLEKASTLVAAR